MSVLTVRLSETEKTSLQKRARAEGISAGALVRRWIRDKPFVTSADLIGEMDTLMGERRLAVRRRA